jgi:DNA topoisomerase-3
VAEKASVGRALANVLPGDKKREENFIRCGEDIVAWASGHLLELCEPEDYDPAYKKWGRDTLLYVPEKWKLKEKERTKTLFSGLKKLIRGLGASDVVVNVGDGDREGQTLIDEILEYCGWKGQTKRLRLNDVNPDAIRKALLNMKDNAEYRGEYEAGQARMRADFLVGLAMTRFVTVCLREAGYKVSALSVGRVQTPTLGLVVTRDREIQNFSPSVYYELAAALFVGDGRKLNGKWLPNDAYSVCLNEEKRITDKETASGIVQKLDGSAGSIVSIVKKPRAVPPPLPFSLSKLQMAASRKYDITDTLAHAQKLYEAGYVTYPRTGCEYIPEGHFSEAGKVIEAIRTACPSLSDMLGGVDLSRKSAAWDDKRITEHHAIIPTTKTPGSLSDKERKIYELVCARYALQFFPDYEYEETVVEFEAGGEKFKAEGRTVINLGWQGWDKQDEAIEKVEKTKEKSAGEKGLAETQGGEAVEAGEGDFVSPLCEVREGETGVVRASVEEKSTKPPKPYTYHSLLAAMNNIHTYVKDPLIKAKLRELQGIGTSATQEGIISTLFERCYTEKKKKQVVSTDLGRLLIDLLTGDGASKASVLVYPDMTALWEQKMGGIESGGVSLESFVAEVAGMVREILADDLNVPPDIPGLERRKEPDGEVIEAPCPTGCGGNARRFSGKYGFYWKCRCSPDVFFKDSDGRPVVPERKQEAKCPIQGCKGKAIRFTRKDGGHFWKCAKCGSFFNDVDCVPIAAAKGGKNSSGGKSGAGMRGALKMYGRQEV